MPASTMYADLTRLQRPWRGSSALYGNLPTIAGQVMNQEEDDPYRRMLANMGTASMEQGGVSTRAAELASRIQQAQRGGIAATNQTKSMIPSEAAAALGGTGNRGYAKGFLDQLSEIGKMGAAATARQEAISGYRNRGSGGGGGDFIGNYTGPATGRRLALINAAKRWLGTPYSWGGGGLSGPSYGIGRGAGTKGFDCSGLVRMAYARVGIRMPRVSQQQMTRGVRTSIRNLQPGDLVGKGFPAHHIAIYMGNGRIIEAQQTGTRVHIRNIGNGAGWWGIHVKM